MPDTSWFDSALSSKDSPSSTGGNWFDTALGKSSSDLPPIDLKAQADKNMSDAEVTTPQSLSRKYIAPHLQGALTGIGAGIGGTIALPSAPATMGAGPVAGGFAGGMIGNLVSQYLQNQAPDYFGPSGSDPNSSYDQIKHAMGPAANQESAGMGIGAAINAARAVPSIVKAGVPFLNRAKATEQAAEDLNPSESTEDLIKTAQKSAQTVNSKNEYNYNMAAGKFDATANKAPSNYYREIEPEPVKDADPAADPPEMTYAKIQSPIPINRSQVIGKKLQTQVEGMLTGSKITDRPLQSILDTLKPIMSEGISTDAAGISHDVPVTEFQKADALNESIKDVLTRHPDTVNPEILDPESQAIPTLTKFQTALQEDIDRGVKAWGPKAYEQYSAKKDAFTVKSNAANPSLAQKLLIDGVEPETTYESIATHALRDPGTAQQFIRSTNDRLTLAKLAQRQVYDKSIDPTTGTFDPGKALAELSSNPTYNIAIPSQSLSNTKELYKALASNQRSTLAHMSDQMGLKTYAGGGMIFAISHYLPHGSYGALALGTGVGIKISGSMINRLMINPTTARAMIQLARTPASSPLAATLGRTIMGALKGENVEAVNNEGDKFDGRIDNQARFSPQ